MPITPINIGSAPADGTGDPLRTAFSRTNEAIAEVNALGGAAVLNVGTTAGTVAAGDHTHGAATTGAAGFMAAADKQKLDGVATGATANVGTVTSVAVSGAGGISVTGSPVTTSGTVALNIADGALTIAKTTGLQTALDDKSPNAQAQTAVAYSATVTLDLASGVNQMFGPLTLTGNATLANPSNAAVGAVVVLDIRQDATGGRTLSYGTHWQFPGGAPDLSTAASARDVLVGVVIASDYIAATLHKGVAA